MRDSLYEEIASKYDKKGPSEEKVTTQNLRDMFDPNTALPYDDPESKITARVSFYLHRG